MKMKYQSFPLPRCRKITQMRAGILAQHLRHHLGFMLKGLVRVLAVPLPIQLPLHVDRPCEAAVVTRLGDSGDPCSSFSLTWYWLLWAFAGVNQWMETSPYTFLSSASQTNLKQNGILGWLWRCSKLILRLLVPAFHMGTSLSQLFHFWSGSPLRAWALGSLPPSWGS